MKVTAETITDEQIREMLLALAQEMEAQVEVLPRSRVAQAQAIGAQVRVWEDAYAEFQACNAALGRVRNSRREKGAKKAARARCADAWNARTGGVL